mmetsp:Transcript_45133/g.107347  ORF Transcript_45133/g.107347 Transcript_45133/m.107347 type:complete len:296 (-) Transcript_45133:102-989(-)
MSCLPHLLHLLCNSPVRGLHLPESLLALQVMLGSFCLSALCLLFVREGELLCGFNSFSMSSYLAAGSANLISLTLMADCRIRKIVALVLASRHLHDLGAIVQIQFGQVALLLCLREPRPSLLHLPLVESYSGRVLEGARLRLFVDTSQLVFLYAQSFLCILSGCDFRSIVVLELLICLQNFLVCQNASYLSMRAVLRQNLLRLRTMCFVLFHRLNFPEEIVLFFGVTRLKESPHLGLFVISFLLVTSGSVAWGGHSIVRVPSCLLRVGQGVKEGIFTCSMCRSKSSHSSALAGRG